MASNANYVISINFHEIMKNWGRSLEINKWTISGPNYRCDTVLLFNIEPEISYKEFIDNVSSMKIISFAYS